MSFKPSVSFEPLFTKLPQVAGPTKTTVTIPQPVAQYPPTQEMRMKLPTVTGYSISTPCNLKVPITSELPKIYTPPPEEIQKPITPQIIIRPPKPVVVPPPPKPVVTQEIMSNIFEENPEVARKYQRSGKGRVPMLSDNESLPLTWSSLIYPLPKPASSNESYHRVGSIPDGNCFFHSILKAKNPIYGSTYGISSTMRESTLFNWEKVLVVGVGKKPDFFSERAMDLFGEMRQVGNLNKVYNVRDSKLLGAIMYDYRMEFTKVFREQIQNIIGTSRTMKAAIQKALPELHTVMMAYVPDMVKGKEQRDKHAWELVYESILKDLKKHSFVIASLVPVFAEFFNLDVYLLSDSQLANPNSTSLFVGGSSQHISVLGPRDMRPPNDPNKNLPDRKAVVIIMINNNHYDLIMKKTVNVVQGVATTSGVGILGPQEPLIRALYGQLKEGRM